MKNELILCTKVHSNPIRINYSKPRNDSRVDKFHQASHVSVRIESEIFSTRLSSLLPPCCNPLVSLILKVFYLLDLSAKPLSKAHLTCSSPTEDENAMNVSLNDTTKSLPVLTKTDLVFDFHRLNILLLRSVALDSSITVARKVATATMTNAKIHAVVGMFKPSYHLLFS